MTKMLVNHMEGLALKWAARKVLGHVLGHTQAHCDWMEIIDAHVSNITSDHGSRGMPKWMSQVRFNDTIYIEFGSSPLEAALRGIVASRCPSYVMDIPEKATKEAPIHAECPPGVPVTLKLFDGSVIKNCWLQKTGKFIVSSPLMQAEKGALICIDTSFVESWAPSEWEFEEVVERPKE